MINKRPSSNAVIQAEYRLLNALALRKEYRKDSRITEELFTSETAKSIYEAILSLDNKEIEVTSASLLQAGLEIDFNVTKQLIDAIFNVDKDGASTLDDILPSLANERKKQSLISKIDDIKFLLQEPGNIDSNKLLEQLYHLDEEANKSTIEDSPLLNLRQWSDLYIEDLESRKLGRKYSYGDVLLDDNIVKGAYPGAMTIIAGTTSSGKSAFVLSLVNNLIEQNLPCMYLSLEMGSVDTFDRFVAMRCGIPNDELYKPENADSIIEAVRKERDSLANRKNFYFSEDPSISIPKLRSLIREFKQRTHQDYCLIVIDLLTQLKGIMSAKNGQNTATSIELAVNELNEIAKSENVHIIGVVQFNRETDNVKIHSVEDIQDLRPSLANIKNSAAFAERGRVVLSLMRPKYYAEKYLVPINAPGAEDVEDILEVQILKNSSGQTGQILKYTFDGPVFKILPIVEEEDSAEKNFKDDFYNFS